MKARFLCLCLVFVASVMGSAQTQGGQGIINHPLLPVPTVNREVRAVWMTTVFGIDWPSTSGNTASTVTAQRAAMNSTLDLLKAMNMNTVILQVRSQCDTMYPSTLEPWSNYLTGRLGRAPASNYDPLAEWIAACKIRGMWCMAWFNPYRALVRAPAFNPPTSGNWDDAGTSVPSSNYVPPNHVYRQEFSIVRQVTSTIWWMDPGEPTAAARAKAAIMDVVNRYDIDGVVFDDYFYPSGATTSFDATTFATYGAGLSRANWRRKNTDTFVQDINQSIKAVKPNLLFGIGPNGIYISGQPAGTVGQSAFNDLYADTKKWLQQGWVDFLSPQLYWQITPPAQSYTALSNWWVQQNTLGRHLWISNASYRMAVSDGDWPVSELVNQVGISRSLTGTKGNIFYNASSFQDDLKSVRSTFTNGIYAQPALVPRTTWTPDQTAPSQPVLNLLSNPTNLSIAITTPAEQPRWYYFSILIGTTWQHQIFNGTTTSILWPRKNGGLGVRAFAISAADRYGNASPFASRTFDITALFTGPQRDMGGQKDDSPLTIAW